MIVFKKKNSKKLLFLLFLFIIILIFSLYKTIYLNTYSNFKQKIMTFEHGFSTPRNLFLGNQSNQPSLFEFAKNIYRGISFKLDNFNGLSNNGQVVETLDITIKFKEYRKLLDDRKSALNSGILINPRKVKALIKHGDKVYKAAARLKGDYSDHWNSVHRMSLRIDLKNGSIFGLTRFSIQKNESRAFPYDQIFGELSKNIGNIAPYQSFARISVNGNRWGIMNIEEHMSKELLEKQNRKESLIFRFGSDLDSKYGKITKNEFNNNRFGDDKLNTNLYQEKKYLSDPQNRLLLSFISKKRLEKNVENIFDIKKYTNSFALASVWGNWHALSSMNSRNYLNPYTLKLEPITTDNGMPGDLYLMSSEGDLLSKKVLYPYNEILRSSKYKRHMEDGINSINDTLEKVDEIRRYYQGFFPLDKKVSLNILNKNYDFLIEKGTDQLLFRASEKANSDYALPSVNQSKEFPVHVYFRHFNDGKIEVFNLLPDDVKIVSIKHNNLFIPVNRIIKGFKKSKYQPIVLKTIINGIADNKIEITTEYKGNIRYRKNGISLISEPYLNPLTDLNPLNGEFIKEVTPGHWVIKKGNWRIDEPLVIDGSLSVEAGTKIIFDDNSYLIVQGNLFAKGNIDERILFSTDSYWKGIYVLGDDKSESILNYVDVKKTGALSDGLLKLTGGINFYNSNVTIANSNFDETTAEDALNIVNSVFEIYNLNINGTVSDAFDADFSTGIINNSIFTNIGGDAIDVSGSKVNVRDVIFKNIKDKALSVGEASNVTAKNLNIEKVGVGIASKDGSSVHATNIFIKNYFFKALMTYVKKDFYAQPILLGKEIQIEPMMLDSFVAQKGTTMTINGYRIISTEVNVEDLYNSKIMKK